MATVDATVDAFNSTACTLSLATLLAVAPSAIRLSVAAASVRVTAAVAASSSAESARMVATLDGLSVSELSSALGVPVVSKEPATSDLVPSAAVDNATASALSAGAGDDATPLLVGGGGALGALLLVLVLGAACCLVRRRWRRRGRASHFVAQPATRCAKRPAAADAAGTAHDHAGAELGSTAVQLQAAATMDEPSAQTQFL